MTDDDKRQQAFERALMGEVLRDAFTITADAKFAYLLGRLDGALSLAAKLEAQHDAR